MSERNGETGLLQSPLFTTNDLVPLVQALRKAMLENWNKEQACEGGVVLILVDNSGFVAITSSPGVDVTKTLEAAVLTHTKPEASGNIHAREGIVESDQDVDTAIGDEFEGPRSQAS